MKNGLHIDKHGTKRWYTHGKLHREDGPALETASGSKFWYHNDKLHREDGPAQECADGTKLWYHNGQYHREDGPAQEWAHDMTSWYLNGKYLGDNAKGFWALWSRLTPEQQNNLNLHLWMAKYT